MSDAQRVLGELKAKGWTIAAIADEMDVHRETVANWDTARHPPANAKVVVMALESLLRRQRVPKRRRYTKSPPTP